MNTEDAIKILLGALTALLAIFGFVWDRLQRRKMRHVEIFHRESHNLRLFRALSDNNQRLQMAAAALLMERLKQESGTKSSAVSDRMAIIRALVSVTKDAPTRGRDRGVSPELSKFIADSVPKALRAFMRRGSKLPPRSPLKDYDWQGARLDGAWWQDIDARGVDFFGAHLNGAGMRRAHLAGGVFKGAKLRNSVLVEADLQEADLRGADLCGANLEGAILENAKLEGAMFDGRTKFPAGFDPGAALMVASVEMETGNKVSA